MISQKLPLNSVVEEKIKGKHLKRDETQRMKKVNFGRATPITKFIRIDAVKILC